ncbi:MAG: CoA transferase [Halioglobus sp.]
MKPFEGITIIECSTMITASFAAMMMGEQGARVIKVEPIAAGDPMRSFGTNKGGMAGLFTNCNRGKESVRIDLKCEDGQALMREIVQQADIVIHNFRPGVMDKLNLGSEALRALNPRLVYMAISGFGKDGPLGHSPAYDPIIQAHAGFTASQGGDEPVFVKNLMCDKITAYTACQAVTAALYVREKTGEGQHIDLSMLDSGLFFLFPDEFMNHTLLDDDAQFQPILSDLLYDLTHTKDGSLTITAGTAGQRAGILAALGREDLMTDPRFDTMEKLFLNLDEYRGILNEAFMALTTDEALKLLQENDVPCAKCHTLDEVLAQPQLEANKSFDVQAHPLAGNIRVMKTPARFGGEVLDVGSPAPAHGEHTESALKTFGVSDDRLQSLKEAGAVA